MTEGEGGRASGEEFGEEGKGLSRRIFLGGIVATVGNALLSSDSPPVMPPPPDAERMTRSYASLEDLRSVFDAFPDNPDYIATKETTPPKLEEIDRELLSLWARRYPAHFLEIVPVINPTDVRTELYTVATRAPETFINHREFLQPVLSEKEYNRLLLKVFTQDPQLVADPSHKRLVEELPYSEVRNCLLSLKFLEPPFESSILLDKLVHGGLSESAAVRILRDPSSAIMTLIAVQTRPGHLGAISVDRALGDTSLDIVDRINLSYRNFKD